MYFFATETTFAILGNSPMATETERKTDFPLIIQKPVECKLASMMPSCHELASSANAIVKLIN